MRRHSDLHAVILVYAPSFRPMRRISGLCVFIPGPTLTLQLTSSPTRISRPINCMLCFPPFLTKNLLYTKATGKEFGYALGIGY